MWFDIYGSLLTKIQREWIVSVVGSKGVGKDLLVHELASYWLNQGYGFYGNQFSLWNDPLYVDLKDRPDFLSLRRKRVEHLEYDDSGQAYVVRVKNGSCRAPIKNNLYPDIYHRIVVLSEAGKYLRAYAYFENLFEFARKVKNIFFFPSTREAHVDLTKLLVFPIVVFKEYFGVEGGLWGWTHNTGYRKPEHGMFFWLPGSRYVGVYDTDDFTESSNAYLKCIEAEIEIDQITRGRNGIQEVVGNPSGDAAEYQLAISRRAEQIMLSLQAKRR